MNREECLDVLKNMANCWIMESLDLDEASKEADEVIEYFTELVERDTPKKGVIKIDELYGSEDCYCPLCDEYIEPPYELSNFCPDCGQHLYWENK